MEGQAGGGAGTVTYTFSPINGSAGRCSCQPPSIFVAIYPGVLYTFMVTIAPRAPTALTDADAYDRLLDLVVRGELAPGARVTEPMLGVRLGLSRTPIREAMQRLYLEGLLVGAGGGARPRMGVAPLDRDEAQAVYETTGLLEGAAGRIVATWPATRRTALAAALRRDDQAFQRTAQSANPDAAALYDTHHAFHQRIVRETANAVTQGLLRSLEPRLKRYEWFHGPLLQLAGLPFAPTYDEHGAIISAVRRGTARDIEQAIRTNWTNAAARLAEAITRARAVVGT
jgi:DNA-binding GntR family transcriptional regulator